MTKRVSKTRPSSKKKRAPRHVKPTPYISESTRRKLRRSTTKYWARVHQIAERSHVPVAEARRRYRSTVVELLVRTPSKQVRQRFIETTPPGTPEKKRRYAEIPEGKPRRLAFASKKRYPKKVVDRLIKTQRYVAGVRRISELTGMSYRDAQSFASKTGSWRYEKYMSGKALLQFAKTYYPDKPQPRKRKGKQPKKRSGKR